MGLLYKKWIPRSEKIVTDLPSLSKLLLENRLFEPIQQLAYGDYGLEQAYETVKRAILEKRRIALYADYDVDGTMSCVSWIWFFQSIGFTHYTHYIPDRMSEGYGVNLAAIQYLALEQRAEVIITMDTGITANLEAQWCKENGVQFICTDHHKIQPEKMPDCIILNPKMHPDPHYQELCGCGITFVLLRKLGLYFKPPQEVWGDILALTGMATICDVVPLNRVNHRLAQLGVQSILRSQRQIFKKLLEVCADPDKIDESDVGFRLGPRINAVGRLDHADKVVRAFIHSDVDPLVQHMSTLNEARKKIQAEIVREARQKALSFPEDPILFIGGDWHPGVVGIAASKIAEEFRKPVWLFQEKEMCKGSARSVPGFDVTEAMSSAKEDFTKFGGHKAAGGYSFQKEKIEAIREKLVSYAQNIKDESPELWESKKTYDCALPLSLANTKLVDLTSSLRPYGHEFEAPVFMFEAVLGETRYVPFQDPKHTSFVLKSGEQKEKVIFFNQLFKQYPLHKPVKILSTVSSNFWQGRKQLSLMGIDIDA